MTPGIFCGEGDSWDAGMISSQILWLSLRNKYRYGVGRRRNYCARGELQRRAVARGLQVSMAS